MRLQVLLTLSAGVLAAGMTCSEIYELGGETCGEDMTAACLEDSQCQNLIAQGLETCTEEDMVYDEEAGQYASALAGIRESEAGMRLACSPCGGAFMQFYMMAEDTSVCGGERFMSVCQAGTLCHGAMQNVTNMCTDDDTFFDDEAQEDVNILDIMGEFSTFCSPSPCGGAFMQFSMMVEDASVCGENLMSVCQAGTVCHGAMQNVTNMCTDDDTFEDVNILDMMGQLSMYCSPCGMAYAGLGTSCEDEDTRCDKEGPCQTALETVRSTCTDEDADDLAGTDEPGMSLDLMLGWFDRGCASMPEPKCVEIPRQHPIWSSPIMNNKKPRECNVMN